MNERTQRRFPRIASQHTVLIRRTAGDEVEGFARTRTIAVGGCSVISASPLGIDAPLELLIAVDGRVINARGRVVYENPIDDERCEVGVEFTSLADDEAEIIARVFEKPTVE